MNSSTGGAIVQRRQIQGSRDAVRVEAQQYAAIFDAHAAHRPQVAVGAGYSLRRRLFTRIAVSRAMRRYAKVFRAWQQFRRSRGDIYDVEKRLPEICSAAAVKNWPA